MRSHNNPRRYPDGFIKRKPAIATRPTVLQLTDDDLGAVAAQRNNRLHARRIRHVARVMVVAAKTGASAHDLLRTKRKRAIISPFIFAKNNAPRFAAVLFLCGFAVSSLLLPLLQANNEKLIQLNQASKLLVGDTRDDASKYLKYDDKSGQYTFAAESRDTTDTYDHAGRLKDAYQATIPKKASSGITVTDTESKIDITLTPQFFTTEVEKSDGNNLIYRSGNRQVVYTLKYNGLKEDIILPSYQGDELQFNFRLSLPAGVEARLDESGNIGIFSADPTLFGNISFGNDADRAKVEKAREKGEKTNLVMTIPFPVVKDAKGKEYSNKARYTLGDKRTEKRSVDLPDGTDSQLSTFTTYNLNIQTNSLKPLVYPISIDPTVQVTSSTDFNGLQLDGSVALDTTNNLIKRNSLTGGTVQGWTTDDTTSPFSSWATYIHAYNNYLYATQGGSLVYSAPLNFDGSVGAFTSTGRLPINGANQGVIQNGYLILSGNTQWQRAKLLPNGQLGAFSITNAPSQTPSRQSFAVTAYNGFVYFGGGTNPQTGCPLACVTPLYNDIQKAKINADGSLTWSIEDSFSSGRDNLGLAAYNNTLYVLGGWDESDGTALAYRTVQYSKINPSDGSIGSFSSTTVLNSGRTGGRYAFISGYLYAITGWDNVATVEYAQVNADGSLGTWRLTTSINGSGRGGGGVAVYNNFIYIISGLTNGGSTEFSDLQYTAINPPGSTANWTTLTNQFTTGRSHPASVAYNGYLYIAGGSTTADTAAEALSDVQYAPINNDGTLGSWAATTSFTTKRIYHDLVAYNGYLYIVGGRTNNGVIDLYLNDVQYAQINTSNGTVGSWTATQTFDNARGEFATVVYNGYMYIMGGRNGNDNSFLFSDVQKATIDSSGALSVDFATTGVAQLPEGRLRTSVTTAGGRLYLVAGCVSVATGDATCNNSDRDILYTDVINSSTGGFTSWTRDTTKLGGPTNPNDSYDYGEAMVVNGYLYVVGGANGFAGTSYAPLNAQTGATGSWARSSTVTMRGDWTTTSYRGFLYSVGGGASRSVSYAQVNNGGPGSTSSWTTDSGTSFNTARHQHASVVNNSYLYIIGGSNTTTRFNDVQYAPINSDGSIGTWVTDGGTSFTTVRESLSSVVYNGYLYIMGGFSGTVYLNDVQYAPINSDGSIGTWVTDGGTSFSGIRSSFSSVTYNGNLYIIGGYNGTATRFNDVQYAPINSDGSIGTWVTDGGTSFTTARNGHKSVVNNGYLYIIGGTNGALLNDVQYAPINSDGSIGTWVTTTSFANARYGLSATVYGGFLYIIGGEAQAANYKNDVQYAPIQSNGSIGKWEGASSITTGRFAHTSVVANGRIYMAGGYGGAYYNDVQYATMQSIARTSQFTKVYDFGDGVKPTKLITRGTKQNGSTTSVSYFSTNNGAVTLDNIQGTADTGYTGANALSLSLGSNRTLSRYLLVRYTIDDSLSAAFPDSGNESTITDFDMYYIANPGERLRGGRSFNNGTDRGLDAQPQ